MWHAPYPSLGCWFCLTKLRGPPALQIEAHPPCLGEPGAEAGGRGLGVGRLARLRVSQAGGRSVLRRLQRGVGAEGDGRDQAPCSMPSRWWFSTSMWVSEYFLAWSAGLREDQCFLVGSDWQEFNLNGSSTHDDVLKGVILVCSGPTVGCSFQPTPTEERSATPPA